MCVCSFIRKPFLIVQKNKQNKASQLLSLSWKKSSAFSLIKSSDVITHKTFSINLTLNFRRVPQVPIKIPALINSDLSLFNPLLSTVCTRRVQPCTLILISLFQYVWYSIVNLSSRASLNLDIYPNIRSAQCKQNLRQEWRRPEWFSTPV